jgi:predicted amidohydrolase
MGTASGDQEADLRRAERLVREAANQGAEHILLPESYVFFLHDMKTKSAAECRAEAQTLEGPVGGRMLALARELKIKLAFGLLERRGERVLNTLVFLTPQGIAGTYSKRVLVTHQGVRRAFARAGDPVPELTGDEGPDEAAVCDPGEGDGVIEWGGVRTGALICADGGSEGLWRSTASQDVELICYALATGSVRKYGLDPSEQAGLHGVPVLVANHIVTGVAFPYLGESMVVDRDGRILAEAPRAPDVIVAGEVRLAGGGE